MGQITNNLLSTTMRTETFHSWMIAEWVHIHVHPDAITKIRNTLAVKTIKHIQGQFTKGVEALVTLKV